MAKVPWQNHWPDRRFWPGGGLLNPGTDVRQHSPLSFLLLQPKRKHRGWQTRTHTRAVQPVHQEYAADEKKKVGPFRRPGFCPPVDGKLRIDFARP